MKLFSGYNVSVDMAHIVSPIQDVAFSGNKLLIVSEHKLYYHVPTVNNGNSMLCNLTNILGIILNKDITKQLKISCTVSSVCFLSEELFAVKAKKILCTIDISYKIVLILKLEIWYLLMRQ